MSKEEKERERSVKKDNILKSLASQRLTEKEILRDVGDSRCAPSLTCEPFSGMKIYGLNRYVEGAAEFCAGIRCLIIQLKISVSVLQVA